MQFAVPQFTDVEDKLIGPLTLKQFLILLATGGLIMMFYSLLKLSLFFFVFALPIALLGITLAFGTFNGRPMLGYFPVFISYLSKPQVRIFRREDVDIAVSFKKTQTDTDKSQTKAEIPSESRLKKLAYLLDQKTEEEKKLIEKDNGQN